MQRAVRVRLLLKIERFLLSRILALVGRRCVLRRRCRSAGSSIIAAGIQDKKGENAEIFKKLHIDDCRVELKLKKRCSLFLKAYGFYKNMRNAIHPGAPPPAPRTAALHCSMALSPPVLTIFQSQAARP